MGKKTKKKIITVAAICLFSYLVATLLEIFVFNYRALTDKYEPIDIVDSCEMGDGAQTYEFSMDQERYVKKVVFEGSVSKKYSYTVEYDAVNAFGKKNEKQVTDSLNSKLTRAVTKIDEKIQTLTITISTDENLEFDHIWIENEFQYNIYRVMLITLSCFFFLFLFLERDIVEHRLHIFFLIYSLAFGLYFIGATGPRAVTWDEEVHFGRIYRMVQKDNVEWTKIALEFYNREIPLIDSYEEFEELNIYMNQDTGNKIVQTEEKDSNYIKYDYRAYTVMAALFKIGQAMKFNFTQMYMFGKLGNLMIYVFLLYHAIKLANTGRTFITVISLMPTVLFQGSNYTYDGLVYAFLVLGCVLWKNEMEDRNKLLTWKKAFAIIGCIVMGSLSKAIYIPLILMLLMLPSTKFRTKKQEYYFKLGIVVVFLLVMATFVLPALSNTVAGNLSYGGDTRGGDTSTVRQLISMMKHPSGTVKLFIDNIFSLENFRNVGQATLDEVIATNLAFLNFATYGVLNDKWTLFLLPLLLFVLMISGQNDNGKNLEKKQRAVLIIILLFIVALIWAALYLSFTPVGEDYIDGVQVRYYLPILLVLSYAIRTERIKISMKRLTYHRVALMGVNFFMLVCIYELYIKARLW